MSACEHGGGGESRKANLTLTRGVSNSACTHREAAKVCSRAHSSGSVLADSWQCTYVDVPFRTGARLAFGFVPPSNKNDHAHLFDRERRACWLSSLSRSLRAHLINSQQNVVRAPHVCVAISMQCAPAPAPNMKFGSRAKNEGKKNRTIIHL